MNIRLTTKEDYPVIAEIYSYAREMMRNSGNPNQWGTNRPPVSAILHDIDAGQSYVMEDNGRIFAVFAFIIGNDPTYDHIENGCWLNDKPYGTIHRIAGDGTHHQILEKALAYCETKISNLRADTHADNKIMQHLLTKNGFQECGIIYVDDGTPRIAYQKICSPQSE